MKVAAIDVGTNSTRLLVAEVINNKVQSICRSFLETTRLGEGMASGCLKQEAMERTLRAVNKFVQQARAIGAQRVVLGATSAVRDAKNGREFAEKVSQACGEELWIIEGEEEAALSYQGVLTSMDSNIFGVLVVDLGGGSTEFCWQEEKVNYLSLKLGAVRMTEGRHSPDEIKKILAPVLKRVNHGAVEKIVAVGGTATTVAAMILQLEEYDWKKVHGFTVNLNQLSNLYQRLRAMSLEERRAVPGLQPKRADIILAGMGILQLIIMGMGKEEFTVSEGDILWGMVLKAANVGRKRESK